MTCPSYQLMYDDVDVGELHQVDADFPHLWGIFTSSSKSDRSDVRQHIEAYIQYSIAANKLWREAGEEAFGRFTELNESQFSDLIESEAWYLLDTTGSKQYILVPLFHVDSEIVWRWHPTL